MNGASLLSLTPFTSGVQEAVPFAFDVAASGYIGLTQMTTRLGFSPQSVVVFDSKNQVEPNAAVIAEVVQTPEPSALYLGLVSLGVFGLRRRLKSRQ